jgi:hypothetical protein
MSTKIFTGFFVNTINMRSALTILESAKQKMRAVAAEKYKREMARIIAHIIDAGTLGTGNVPELSETSLKTLTDTGSVTVEPSHEATMIYLESRKTVKGGTRSPFLDFTCSMTLIPRNGFCLGILYCEQQEFYSILLKEKCVREFGYWNNTDKPDNVTSAQWRHRRDTWDAAFKKSPIPSLVGFTTELFGEYEWPADPTEWKTMMTFAPTLEDRAQRQAEQLIGNRWLNRQRGQPFNFVEFSRFMRKDETQADIRAFAKTLKKELKRRLTWKDITVPVTIRKAKPCKRKTPT